MRKREGYRRLKQVGDCEKEHEDEIGGEGRSVNVFLLDAVGCLMEAVGGSVFEVDK